MQTPHWQQRQHRQGVKTLALTAAMVALLSASYLGMATGSESGVVAPAPMSDAAPPSDATVAEAVFAGGCFWGVQGVFQHVRGVTGAVSGYTGGSAETATYERVGTGASGHAEAVRVRYDPRQISYGQLLQIYFTVAHNPTERNRQGPDVGPQYRSAVFPANAEQERVARSYIAQLDAANTFGKALATTVEPLKVFYPAEAYHQDFLVQNPRNPYIVVHDLPKVDALKRMFPASYRPQPVLATQAFASL